MGELGPTLSLEERLFGGAGEMGEMGPQHTFLKFCLFVTK